MKLEEHTIRMVRDCLRAWSMRYCEGSASEYYAWSFDLDQRVMAPSIREGKDLETEWVRYYRQNRRRCRGAPALAFEFAARYNPYLTTLEERWIPEGRRSLLFAEALHSRLDARGRLALATVLGVALEALWFGISKGMSFEGPCVLPCSDARIARLKCTPHPTLALLRNLAPVGTDPLLCACEGLATLIARRRSPPANWGRLIGTHAMAQAIADLAEEKSRRNLNARAMYLTGVLVEWGPYFHGNVDSEARLEHNDLTYANETPTKPGTGDFVEFARKAAHAYAEAVESLVSGDVNDPGLARKVQQTAQPLLLPHALWYEAAMKYRDADEDLPHSGEPSSH